MASCFDYLRAGRKGVSFI